MDFIVFQELQSEFNAQYDSVREAYAATALDATYEGYCDYCNACNQDGTEPQSYDAYRASLRKPHVTAPFRPTYAPDEEIPL